MERFLIDVSLLLIVAGAIMLVVSDRKVGKVQDLEAEHHSKQTEAIRLAKLNRTTLPAVTKFVPPYNENTWVIIRAWSLGVLCAGFLLLCILKFPVK